MDEELSKMLFSRGSGPLVSILIPSRERSGWLLSAMDSCYSLAMDKSLLEFVLRLDEDDKQSVDLMKEVQKSVPVKIKIVVAPRGRGYVDSADWCRQMSEVASGDWLFLFNDDARMAVHGWDQILLRTRKDVTWHGTDELFLMVAPTLGSLYNNEFIFLRRAVFEILGRWGLSPQSDSWMYAVMSMLGSAKHSMIHVRHYRHEHNKPEEQDKVHKEVITSMAQGEEKTDFNHPDWIRARLADSLKLLDWAEKKRNSASSGLNIKWPQNGFTLPEERKTEG